MKAASLCLVGLMALASIATAQTQLEKQLSAKIKPGPKQFGEISEADKALIIRKTAEILRKHVTFRSDGSACSYFKTTSGSKVVEWTNLRINMLVPAPLGESDKKKGIEKRIQALLVYDAYRELDQKTKSWGAWGGKGHPLFPPAITLEWQRGHPIPNTGLYLDKFTPGPMVSPRGALTNNNSIRPGSPSTPSSSNRPSNQGVFQNSSGNRNLPPGMKPK